MLFMHLSNLSNSSNWRKISSFWGKKQIKKVIDTPIESMTLATFYHGFFLGSTKTGVSQLEVSKNKN